MAIQSELPRLSDRDRPVLPPCQFLDPFVDIHEHQRTQGV
jgi:hypothetical protein